MQHDHNATKAKTFFYMIPNAQRVSFEYDGYCVYIVYRGKLDPKIESDIIKSAELYNYKVTLIPE